MHVHTKKIFLFLLIVIMVSFHVCAPFRAHGLSPILRTEATAISTDNRISSADALAQNAIPASRESIVIGDFKFRVAKVTFDETAMRFIPVDMGPDDRVMFVEFELLEGSKDAFKALEIAVADGSGQKSNAFIVTSGGMIQMLATVVMKSASLYYQPGEDSIAWAYVVPRDVSKLYLNFPTGEIIELTPVINSFRCAATSLCHEYRKLDNSSFLISGLFCFLGTNHSLFRD